MKKERRHELQTNRLADITGLYLKKIHPYQKQILYGAVAVAVLGGAVLYLSAQQQARAGASWEDYFSAMVEQRPEALEDVARLHKGSTAALWAHQGAGDIKLAMGASLLYRDRKEAKKNLQDAEKEFLAVEQQGARHPLLLQRSRYGLAQVYESQCDVKKAREYYGKVAAAEPDSALGQLAQRRLDQISGTAADGWFNWFDRQEPKPPAGMQAATGVGPKVPADLELPERPDLSFPASDVAKQLKETPSAPPPAPETKTKPAAPETKPEAKSEGKPVPAPTEKPAPASEAKPAAAAEAKPAPEAKPAAEPATKPATEPEKKSEAAPKSETSAPAEAKPAASAPAPAPPAEQPKP